MLKDFTPHHILGKGGMGVVRQAVHRKTGQEVAVKLLLPKRADEKFLTDELHALARLDHPNIVQVFDWGRAEGDEDEWNTQPGQPYIVLELVDGAPLSEARANHWQLVKLILLGILDALSHAHARGVIHRDLKPSNISVHVVGPRLDLKLLDYGIAQLHNVSADETAEGLSLTGTPKYMAPEQIQGNRKIGAWTDLYSLGCIAYALVTGQPPFVQGDRYDILKSHITDPVPAMKTHVPVPDGFEEWVAKLLQKRPQQRFQLAADAAHALLRLGDPSTDQYENATVTTPDAAPTEVVNSIFDHDTWDDLERPAPANKSVFVPPPMPATWHEETAARETASWESSALSIFHIKRFPLIGRTAERDQLWSALRETTLGFPQIVSIRGDSGLGKTRLAHWFGERAEEVGAARVLVLRAGDGPKSAGLMLRRFFGVHRNSKNVTDEVREWFALHKPELDPADLMTCVTLVDLMFPEDAPSTRRHSEKAQIDAVCQVLLHMGRPVILTVDDVDSDPFALELASQAAKSRAPLLVCLTHSQKLTLNPDLEIRLQALDPKTFREFVVTAAQLGGETIARLEERTGCNPLYTLKILGDWVDRGVLTPQRGRLRLTQDDPPLPQELRELISSQLKRSLDADVGKVAQIAATLGLGSLEQDVIACASELGLIGQPAIDRIVAAGLMTRSYGTLQFNNGVTRETLLADAGRNLPIFHGICAKVLSGRAEFDPTLMTEIATHYEKAGQAKEAAQAYLGAAQIHDFFLTLAEQKRCLERYDATISAIDEPRVWRCTRLRLEARQVANSGRVDDAREIEKEAMELALATNDAWSQAHCHFMHCQLRIGDPIEHGLKSIQLFEVIGDSRYELVTKQFHTNDLIAAGDYDAAEAILLNALELARESGELPMEFSIALGLADFYLTRMRVEDATPFIEEMERRVESAPDLINLAGTMLCRIDLHFLQGEFEQGRLKAARVMDILDGTNSGYMDFIVSTHLAALELADGNIERAQVVLERIDHWRESSLKHLFVALDLYIAAVTGDEERTMALLDAQREVIDAKHRTNGLEVHLFAHLPSRTKVCRPQIEALLAHWRTVLKLP